jgi:hypothetical protein
VSTSVVHWVKNSPRLSVATSDNGWTDDEVGFQWFKDIFVPQATARNRRATHDTVDGPQLENEGELPPILLIYDGHGSHTTLEWITHARANNDILFCLIPHTTH